MTRSAVRLMCYCVCVFFCVLVEQPPPPPPHTCACALAVCGGLAVCELGLPSPLNLAHICVLPSLVRSKGKATPFHATFSSPHTQPSTPSTRACVWRGGGCCCVVCIYFFACVWTKRQELAPPAPALSCTHTARMHHYQMATLLPSPVTVHAQHLHTTYRLAHESSRLVQAYLTYPNHAAGLHGTPSAAAAPIAATPIAGTALYHHPCLCHPRR